MPNKPVRPLLLALYIKAAAEGPTGLQDPEKLPISGLLVRESVKAVQRQNDVKGIVCIGKCPHIALPEGHIGGLPFPVPAPSYPPSNPDR